MIERVTMSTFSYFSTRRLTSDRVDAHLGQIACWPAATGILVLHLLRLPSLHLSEVELFFGVLLVIAVTLQAVILGMLLPIA